MVDLLSLRSLVKWLHAAAVVVVVIGLLPSCALALASRTWVSGVGNDANPCSREAPCKTFAGAISKTEAGGEIDALDPGGFGAVTITKAITIDGGSAFGSILVSGTNAIVIQAAPTDDVVLRGISFDGLGSLAEPCPNSGLDAIRIQQAHTVDIENAAINHFRDNGVDVVPGEGNVDVLIDGSDIRNTCGVGVNVAPTNGHTASVTIRNSTISNVGTGILAGEDATAWLTGDTVTANATGIQTTGSGVINSFGDNQIYGNATNGSATHNVDQYGTPILPPVSVSPPAPPPVTVTTTVPIATTKPPVPSCLVPKLTGLGLGAARTRLIAAHCKLGKVTRRKTKKRSRIGAVISQKQKAGSNLANGASVDVTAGKR